MDALRGTIWLVISVQKPAWLLVYGFISVYGTGNLYTCEGTIDAGRHALNMEQLVLSSSQLQQENYNRVALQW